MTTCPCCSNSMLRHIRHHQVYWFCRSCWQEMPLLEQPSLHLVPLTLEQSVVSNRRHLVTV
ncbi:hypothetical protein C7B61_05050 [filamentous cyanobacterium CCP1]|nr:hypothetical protein C7B76_21100 [filamentous cyanobacterium CCP2]PSB67653.1 hypothetical protein C7B61_05050 [filamentous cyanobacterium CCP1]